MAKEKKSGTQCYYKHLTDKMQFFQYNLFKLLPTKSERKFILFLQ